MSLEILEPSPLVYYFFLSAVANETEQKLSAEDRRRRDREDIQGLLFVNILSVLLFTFLEAAMTKPLCIVVASITRHSVSCLICLN